MADKVLPVRTGAAQGDSAERQMLDNAQGAASFTTRIRSFANGETTMLRTRGGFPEFTTLSSEKTVEQLVSSLYLETGQLDVGQTAPAHPDKFKDGTWHFGPISGYNWMGTTRYSIDEFQRATFSPGVINGISTTSGAVGYSGRNTGGSELLEKKFVVKEVPPSMFTGLMRKYVQCLYGAKMSSGVSLYRISETDNDNFVISSAHGTYRVFATTDILHRTADYQYFIVSLGGAITATPLMLNTAGKALQKAIRKIAAKTLLDVNDLETISRMEGYLLAYAYPKPADQVTVASSKPSGLSPLAYGWKANKTGSEAAIVDVASNSGSFTSTLHKVTLSRSSTGVWTATHTAEASVMWLNPWPYMNIFTPAYGSGTVALTFKDGATWFNFTNAPLYCFYDKDNILRVVKASYSDGGPYSYSTDNTHYAEGVIVSWPTAVDRLNEEHVGTQYGYSLSVGDMSIGGNGRSYTRSLYEVTDAGWGEWSPWISGTGDWRIGTSAQIAAIGPNPGLDAITAIQTGSWSTTLPGRNRVSYKLCNWRTRLSAVAKHTHMTLVIPWDDSECVYLLQMEQTSEVGNETTTFSTLIENGSAWYVARYDNIMVAADNVTEVPVGITYTMQQGPEVGNETTTSGHVSEDSVSSYSLCKSAYGNQTTKNNVPESLIRPSSSYPFSSYVHRTRSSWGGKIHGDELADAGQWQLMRTFSGWI